MATALPVQRTSLVDRLVADIFDDVIEGRLSQGSKITEEEIAARFEVSRTPVREAFKRLADMGILVVWPRSGIEVVSFDEEDLRQILELRAEYETFALRLAMARMDRNQVEELARQAAVCEAMLKTGNRVQVFREDSRFHLMIGEFSGNQYLEDAMRRLDVKVQLCRMIFCASMSKVKNSVRFHWKIVDAIRAGDVKQAEALLREHILS